MVGLIHLKFGMYTFSEMHHTQKLAPTAQSQINCWHFAKRSLASFPPRVSGNDFQQRRRAASIEF